MSAVNSILDKINIALAKWMGWTLSKKPSIWVTGLMLEVWTAPDGKIQATPPPRYTTSLDAVAQIEARLTGWGVPTTDQADIYCDELITICVRDGTAVIVATAAQKCQALVRALGLDGEGAE